MRKNYQQWGIYGILLALLGFASSCRIGGKMMYGTPSADFQIKTKVMNQAGVPIEGIRVTLGKHQEYPDYNSNYTNAQGIYEIKYNGFPSDIVLNIEDPDGAHNGSYRDTTITHRITEKDYIERSDDGWYQGVIKKDFEVKLEEKK